MIWGALRFSDAQRLALGSCQIERGILRGWCYRTKTSKDGMPFGVLTLGIHDCWDKGVSHLCDHLGHGDFLIPGPSGACQLRLRIRAISQVAGSYWWPFDRASAELYPAQLENDRLNLGPST